MCDFFGTKKINRSPDDLGAESVDTNAKKQVLQKKLIDICSPRTNNVHQWSLTNIFNTS